MKLSQIAAQLYTLRDFLKTPDEIALTLRKVADIGYQAVQVSGMGPIPEEELLALLQANGLVCCATHESPQTIRTAPEKVVERLRKLRCRHTAYPYPADVDWTKWESVDSLVADLDRAGSVLRQAGQVLTYHNHATEFFRLPGTGQTALDYLYAKTSPQNLQAEIDTYWVQHGGGDPVAWCRKLRGRLPLLHLKDYEVTAEQKPNYAAIGQGNLDWPAILAAAGEAGCQWYIVEQDVCPGDPFDSLRTSFDYLAAHTDGH